MNYFDVFDIPTSNRKSRLLFGNREGSLKHLNFREHVEVFLDGLSSHDHFISPLFMAKSVYLENLVGAHS